MQSIHDYYKILVNLHTITMWMIFFIRESIDIA
jgi:hypothetical protein